MSVIIVIVKRNLVLIERLVEVVVRYMVVEELSVYFMDISMIGSDWFNPYSPVNPKLQGCEFIWFKKS